MQIRLIGLDLVRNKRAAARFFATRFVTTRINFDCHRPQNQNTTNTQIGWEQTGVGSSNRVGHLNQTRKNKLVGFGWSG